MTDGVPNFAVLKQRGVLRVSGADAGDFLQGIITGDTAREAALFAALLTPRGKVLWTFFLTPDSSGFLLDCAQAHAEEMRKQLLFYRLRADVEIDDVSDRFEVAAVWGGAMPSLKDGPGKDGPGKDGPGRWFADPRLAEMGARLIAPVGTAWDCLAPVAQEAEAAAWHVHRLALGVPDDATDIPPGEMFPLEANLDLLHGIDFHKGCFIGQEVASRTWRRGTVRKRLLPVRVRGPLPAPGTAVEAPGRVAGVMRTGSDGRALALLRLDEAHRALEEPGRLHAGAVPVVPLWPAWMPPFQAGPGPQAPGSQASGP